MDNLDNFKLFIKQNPTFANYIKDGTMTWQKFYELYDMYGEDSSIWDEYKKLPENDLFFVSKELYTVFLDKQTGRDVIWNNMAKWFCKPIGKGSDRKWLEM